MARFSFPVPSRRQRGAATPTTTPTPTAPQKRPQKVPSLSSQSGAWPNYPAQDAPRNWETQSNSCISIAVTDSTISRDDTDAGASTTTAGHRGLSSLTEGHVVNSTTTLRQPTFDTESGVLGVMNTHKELFYGASGADGSHFPHERRSVTDASSLRRKQSSSTIVSYYDKSKVPLAISQQTSSSAMAKGLPSKAKLLLDIDGTLANDASKKKKRKPVGLDLSRVFGHRKANSSTASLSVEPDRPGTRGSGTPKRSPSFLAATRLDHLTRPRSRQRSDHDAHSATHGSLRGRRSKAAVGAAYRNGAYPEAVHDSGPGLEHLYNHYEQRTHRDIPARPDPLSEAEAEDEDPTPEPTPLNSRSTITSDARTNAHTPLRSDTDRYNRPYNAENASLDSGRHPSAPSARHARHPQHTRPEHDDESGILPYYKVNPSYVGGIESVDSRLTKPAVERGGLPVLQLPTDVDCADSISSRHTRTSKASRRTSQSLVDSDLKQISMLSLSSDSEEDDVDDTRPHTTQGLPASPLSPNDTDTETETAFAGSPGPYRQWTSLGPSASQRSNSSSVNQGNTYLNGNPPRQLQPMLDQPYSSTHHYVRPSTSPANQRVSSASLLTASTSKPSSRGTHDSLPVQSPTQSSRRSFASTHTTDSINISSYTVHEARAVTMVPAQGASYFAAEAGQGLASPSELGTPPLSPTSMDFVMHATHFPMLDGEQSSVLSAGSSLRSSVYNSGSNGQTKRTSQGQVIPGNGRLMAVTRQEELLLAALRKKRLRMRESIIAEFGEGLEREPGTAPASQGGSIDVAAAGLRQPRPLSVSCDEPMQFEDAAFPRPPSSASTTSFGPPFGPLPASPALGRPSSRAKRSSFGLVPSYTAPELLGDFDTGDGSELSSRVSDRVDSDSRLDGSGGSVGGEVGDRASTRRHSTDSLGITRGLPAPSKRRYQPRLLVAPNVGRRLHSGGMPGSLLLQPGAASTAPWQSRSPVDDYPVRIVDEPAAEMDMPVDHQYDGGLVDKQPVDDGDGPGIPRPDSPVESALPLPRKRAARISAVGTASMMGGGW